MRNLLIFTGLFSFLATHAQLEGYHKAFVWQGFSHQWTYNHRCNRLGDYVVYNNGKPQAVHTSATGRGADSTYFTSYYSYVATPDVVFKEGKISIKVASREKKLVEGNIDVNIDADEWMQGKAVYKTLVNGFDLSSDEAADKIQLLRLSVDDAVYDSTKNSLKFRVNFSIVLNCQSLECPENNSVSYNLDVYYLIAGMNQPDAMATGRLFTRSYSWDKKEELNEMPETNKITGTSAPNFDKATVGIQGFSVVLNEAHWLLQFNVGIRPVTYNSHTGTMKADVDLLFKEWQEGMRGSNAAPQLSKLSEKRKGWTLLDLNSCLLQMHTAEINYLQRGGKMYWRGANSRPNGQNAVSLEHIDIP